MQCQKEPFTTQLEITLLNELKYPSKVDTQMEGEMLKGAHMKYCSKQYQN